MMTTPRPTPTDCDRPGETSGSNAASARPDGGSRLGWSSRARILVFAGWLAAFGGLLLLVTPDATRLPDQRWSMPFFAVVIAFGIAEAAALHVEIRKESRSLSLSGVVLLLGVLTLSPVLLALAFVLGAAPVLIWIRRIDWVKTVWNLCLFFAEAALASLIVRSVLGARLPASALEWLVPLGAVLAAELLSLFAVALVIMTVDATIRPDLIADIARSQVLATLAGTFAVTAAAASLDDPVMLAYAALPVVGIGALLKSAGQVSQKYGDLQQVHAFTRAITNEPGFRTVDAGLTHLVQIMRARSAYLLTIARDADHATSLRALVDDSLGDLDPGPVAERLPGLLGPARVTELSVDDERPVVRGLLNALGVDRLLAAPVLGEADRTGVLIVGDRLGMRREFGDADIRLFGSLADTLSSRMSNDYVLEQLEVQAQHDALTGLPNRLTFEVALTSAVAAPGASGVVAMIDLDRFKDINDSLGHDTGDRLLVELAARLGGEMRAGDMVARFGGDEFALLLADRPTDAPGAMERRLGDIHARLCERVELDGIEFEVGASLGAVRWPNEGRESTRLIQRADAAMYQAKRNHLGIVWYTPELERDTPRRIDLYLSVRPALEQGRFNVLIQPRVSLEDGRVTGAEALLRWTHPKHGEVSPLEFLPLIDQAGLAATLTRFVLGRSVEVAAMLRDAGLDVPVAVNLTPRDLLDPKLPHDIARLLADADLPASSLQVEMTEDAMVVDFDTSVQVLGAIRELGVQVAVDDFGTGYSSLQHLHRLPVDQLKIDRSFVTRLATDPSAGAIVRASISLADDLGLVTVAEGVEDTASLALLAELGCRELQGYLVSRPRPVVDFIGWARDWHAGGRLDSLAPGVVGSDDVLPGPGRVLGPRTLVSYR